MAWEDGHLAFEQWLARDYSEESAILQAFADRYEQAGVLVTFNGKSFDMSMIRERCAFHAVELPHRRVPHLDLLHESRKRWRGEVPNCRLQTLERHLCRRRQVEPARAAEHLFHALRGLLDRAAYEPHESGAGRAQRAGLARAWRCVGDSVAATRPVAGG